MMLSASEQEVFDRTFIGAGEICDRLKISRTALSNARKNKKIPEHITVDASNVCLWKREEIEPFLVQWQARLDQMRGKPKEVVDA